MCESLEGRRLLSSIPAAVSLASPPAADVASASNILQAKAPAAFANYGGDLAKAELTSHISQAAVNAVALDESQLDRAIEASGLTPNDASDRVNHVQDIIDGAFTGMVSRDKLQAYLRGMSASPQLFHSTLSDMTRLARMSAITPREHATLADDAMVLRAALGPNPDTNLGPDAADRDPLIVYYDGQVGHFAR